MHRTSSHRTSWWASVLVLAPAWALSWAAGASADAVAIPADLACPPGTEISANHGGHWCVARTCATDAECRTGQVCGTEPLGVCTETVTYTVGGRLAGQGPTAHSVLVGRGPCDAACAAPATCQTARRCVDRALAPATAAPAPTAPAPTPTAQSSGCGIAPRGSAHGAWVVGLLACAWALGQRARAKISSITSRR